MLYQALRQYGARDVCPMHMPGHKRNTALLGSDLPYGIDITEIEGFDNLHHPQGILKEVAQKAARLYGSLRSFLLVGGSTAGILASVRAVARPSGTLIMARNCHKSVYNAAELCGLKPVYLMPQLDEQTGIAGSISPRQVADALAAHPDAVLVVVTSPTYEGVVSDIQSISAAAHDFGVPLLVDEAHGAHLGFSDTFPRRALQEGADLVVNSLHKTLPALTQCALLHVGSHLVDQDALAWELSVFQTSSPSYVLMASIDQCVDLLLTRGDSLFSSYQSMLEAFDHAVAPLRRLRALCHGADSLAGHPGFYSFDPGKLVIDVRNTGLSGSQLASRLRREYGIELEMSAPRHAIAMTSLCDRPAHLERLARALRQIDQTAPPSPPGTLPPMPASLPRQLASPANVRGQKGVFLPLKETAGAMSLEYVWAYPPGIPLLVPGEEITSDLLAQMDYYFRSGIELQSGRGRLPGALLVEA